MPPSERRKWGHLVVRLAVVFVLFWVVAAWLVIAINTTAYEGTSGCEDAGVACRTANPTQALIEGSIAVVGIVAFSVVALWQLLPQGIRLGAHRKIGTRAAVVGLIAFATWFGLGFFG